MTMVKSGLGLDIGCNMLIEGRWVTLFEYLRLNDPLDIMVDDILGRFDYAKEHYRSANTSSCCTCWLAY